MAAIRLTCEHSNQHSVPRSWPLGHASSETENMNSRERVLAFLKGQPVDRLPQMPVVMMLCADQVGVKYGRYVKDPQVLADAQIATAEAYGLDIVSNMSDPAREACDCGARVEFYEDQPAAIIETAALLADKATLVRLATPDPLGGGRMHDSVKSLEIMKQRVGQDKIVMGWVEGPCAEAADLRGINTLMLDVYDDPDFVRELFDFTLEMALRYGQAQVDAGADIIGVGDAAASLLGPKFYEELVWPYEKRLVDGLQAMGTQVRLHICGRTSAIVDGMGRLGCEIVDLDYFTPVSLAREVMGSDQVLLGNIDPVRDLRNSTPDAVTAAIAACHQQAGDRYIVGAGCEIPRDTPEENVRALTEYARSYAGNITS